MIKLARAILLLTTVVGPLGFAQTWDNSGNSVLKGTYYFREVIWVVGNTTGALGDAYSFYGNITFDGNGGYTITNAQVMEAQAGAPQAFAQRSGTYAISASGFGFLSNSLSTGDSIYGLVSRGIFIGGTTETTNGFNDLFIAAPVASPAPTNSSFQGAYSMMDLDSPTGSPLDTRESQFQLNPDGNGNIGIVRASGYVAGNGSSVVTQNISGVRYFFSNGGMNLNLGSNGTLVTGTKYLYMSADGSFVFGGSPTGWDMIVGVKTGGNAPSFGGLYYQAGMYQNESQLANGVADLANFYGSLKALSGGILLAHERLFSVLGNYRYDNTYADTYSLKTDGTYDDSIFHYAFGSGGAVRIGIGNPPFFGLNVAVQAPSFPAPSNGVYIDPTGVLNAASSALFTAGVAPGEIISIYGTNLASTTRVDPAFPFMLDGVQVMVNNRPAPIYLVSPNQISAVIPFATSELVASIQVINKSGTSNTVSSYVSLTAPGVLTNPAGGIGYALALHADYSLVTPSSPAQAGEALSLYVTGLGDVNPAVPDGVPAPSGMLSTTTNAISVFIGGKQATTSFAGLAPGYVGLYQINLVVPSGLSSGNNTIDLQGPDFSSAEALLPIGSSMITTAAAPLTNEGGARAVPQHAIPQYYMLGMIPKIPAHVPRTRAPGSRLGQKRKPSPRH